MTTPTVVSPPTTNAAYVPRADIFASNLTVARSGVVYFRFAGDADGVLEMKIGSSGYQSVSALQQGQNVGMGEIQAGAVSLPFQPEQLAAGKWFWFSVIVGAGESFNFRFVPITVTAPSTMQISFVVLQVDG